MEAIAFIYNLEEKKGKDKTYLIRKIFGYKDTSNHGKYKYKREGTLTPHIIEKWGKSVIITKKTQKTKVQHILKNNNISFTTRKLKLIN
jgi:hypothetical protein